MKWVQLLTYYRIPECAMELHIPGQELVRRSTAQNAPANIYAIRSYQHKLSLNL